MKKIIVSITCFIIVAAALLTICHIFKGWSPTDGTQYTAQLSGVIDWLPVITIISFFIGFLPSYIHESLKELKPATAATQEPKEATLTIGQTFTSPAANCTLRVKRIKTTFEILEFHNELLADYL